MKRTLAWVSVVTLSVGFAGCPTPGSLKPSITGLSAGSVDELRQGLAELKSVSAMTAGADSDVGQDTYLTQSYGIQAVNTVNSTITREFLRGGNLVMVATGTHDTTARTMSLEVTTTATDADGNVLEEATGAHSMTFPRHSDGFPKTSTVSRVETVKAGSQLRPAGEHTFNGTYTKLSTEEATSSESLSGTLAEGGVTYTATFERTLTYETTAEGRSLKGISHVSHGEKSDKGSFDTQFTLSPNGDGTAEAVGASTLRGTSGKVVQVSFDATMYRMFQRKRPLPKRFNALGLTLKDAEGKAVASLEFEPFDTKALPFQTKAAFKDASGASVGEFTATLSPGKQTWKGTATVEGSSKEIDLSPVLDGLHAVTR